MTTTIQDVSRAKEKRFVEQANRPILIARKVLRGVAVMFLAIPFVVMILNWLV